MMKENDKKENKTGRYVYDRKLNRIIKISDEIVGIKKSSGSSDLPSNTSCSSGGCCPGCGIN